VYSFYYARSTDCKQLREDPTEDIEENELALSRLSASDACQYELWMRAEADESTHSMPDLAFSHIDFV